MIKLFNKIITCILLVGVYVPVTANAESKPKDYVFGVFPYLSASKMDKIYSPASQVLETSLSHGVKFRTSSSFKRFLAKLKSSYYDFALIQPFWYPVAVDQNGYLPLVRMKEPFVSLIMVIEDSPIKTVNDLKGKVIATPPSFVPVVHMAKRALKDAGFSLGKDVKFKAFKTVESCFQQVMIGKADACVAPPFAPAVFEEAMNLKLRTILKSDAIPNLSLVVHPRIPEATRNRIAEELISWADTENGRKLLSNMQTSEFVPIDDKEYDVVRQLLRGINK